jgi:5-(aminomethyl)-3-furanmethanol phosphate kinase
MATQLIRADAVIKVGGSLYELPDLGPRLSRWLQTLTVERIILVPGGGPLADAVRELDQIHHLGDEEAHWLALRSLSLSARFLQALLPGSVVCDRLAECTSAWTGRRVPVLDPLCFALADERSADPLPHTWSTTSDSLAARVASVAGAAEVILLKSVPVPANLEEASACGLVDPHFCKAAASLTVRTLNFRAWST